MATISTHNGSTLSQGHNRRDIKYTSKDGHIRENGHIEIWKDEPLREAYERIFSDAQKEIKSLQVKNERLKQSNRDLLNELYPGEEKKRNRKEHQAERNHDDFDLEK